MRRLPCAIICLLAAANSLADAEFWVAVASYRDIDRAQEEMDRTNAMLNEPFIISAVQVEGERWYRILTGPFLTRAMAEFTLAEAQQVGFDTAWMLMTQGPEAAEVSGGDASFDYDYAAASRLDEPSELLNYQGLLPDSADGHPDTGSLLPSTRKSRERNAPGTPRDVVGEAPAGYGLHKLHRDG